MLTSIQKFCKYDDTSSLRMLDDEYKIMILKFCEQTMNKYSINNIYRERAIILIDVLSNTTKIEYQICKKNIKGLSWTNNSCYLDSVLMSLMSIDTNFFNRFIKKSDNDDEIQQTIKKELRSIKKNIDKDNDISDLRKILKNSEYAKHNFHKGNMGECFEFVNVLLNILDINNIATKEIKVYGSNDVVTKNPSDMTITSTFTDEHASVVQFIPYYTINDVYDGYESRNFIDYREDSGPLDDDNLFIDEVTKKVYKRRIYTTKLINCPFLIINLERLNGRKFNKKTIYPTLFVTLNNLEKMVLSAIIVYENRHYTAYIRCNDDWYLYNDIDDDVYEYIGEYDDILNIENVTKRSVLLFYEPY